MKGEIIYRKLAAAIFLAAFLAQTFSRVFVVVDYYADTAKYAKDCVNKARPEMHCNGKCQMMKRLQKQEKKDQENPERKTGNKSELILSSKSFFASVVLPQFELINRIKFYTKSDGIVIDRSFGIFHPPKV